MKHRLLSLSAALVLFMGAEAGAGQNANSPAKPKETGRVAGLFDLPDPGGPGHLRWKLKDDQGDLLFLMKGKVIRDPLDPSGGRLVGTAVLKQGPQAGKEFKLVGQWDAEQRGEGFLQARIVKPKKGSAPVMTLIRLRGAFDDPRPAAPGGSFRGSWNSAR